MLSSVRLIRTPLRSIQTFLVSQIQTLSPESPKTDILPEPNSQKYDEETVRETLSCYGNDWKRAMEFFNWLETDSQFKHTTDTFNRMIDILGKFFEFDLSWDLINRMQYSRISFPDHVTFRVLFKRYAAAHLIKEAMNTYNRLDEFNLKDETSYCNLIDALCEYKHVIEAEELCIGGNKNQVMISRDFNVNDTKIHNMILRGWFKMGWWSKCREFWDNMDKKCVAKDLHSYTIYMNVVSKSGKPWKAVKLYKEMKKKGIKLDVVAYNTVIHAIGLSEGVDLGFRLFKEMRELGCYPNVVTYNTIIKLLCENGRLKEAYSMFNDMSKKRCVPNVVTYNCVFGSLENPKEILWLFDKMIESGVRPRMDTCVMLLRKFGRWGFLRPVFVVWKKMEELGCSPDEAAYNALIDVLIEKGMLDMAKMYNEEMVAKGLSCKRRDELRTDLVQD